MAEKPRPKPPTPEPAAAAPARPDSAARVLELALAILVGGMVAWIAGHVLLVIFAGILLGVLLGGLSDALARHTPLGHQLALTAVASSALALAIAVGLLVVPALAGQLDQLWSELTEAVRQLSSRLQQWSWGQALVQSEPLARLGDNIGAVLARVTGLAATTLNLFGALVVIVFIGLYLAAEPDLYVRGIVKLVRPERRARAREVLAELGHTLQWWLIGRAFSMAVIGAMIGVGLWLLGVELALTLGILSGLLNFIPYIGPILAAVPGLLVGFAHDPVTGLWVLGLYVLAEGVESYVLTPVVLRRTVELAPAVALAAQLLGGVFFGFIGIALATPLAAALLVLVRMLYVEDRLHDHGG